MTSLHRYLVTSLLRYFVFSSYSSWNHHFNCISACYSPAHRFTNRPLLTVPPLYTNRIM